MEIISNPRQFQKQMEKLRARGLTIGFVPTMGALHEGHLSLVRAARRENHTVVVSVFLNPLQFGPREDLKRYPRSFLQDRCLLSKEKVNYLFHPNPRLFYPSSYQTVVDVLELSRGLCGRFRPGHFRGVATVVAKLFNIVRPHRAYFGAKDYQQAMIVKQLARDLNFDLEVKVLPIVRDSDGLALSSRNRYLSRNERKQALAIPNSLRWAKAEVRRGKKSPSALRSGVISRLRKELDRIDYVELLEPETLKGLKAIGGRPFVLAVAGWVGKTRLIDNAIIRP